ncbi:bifunctional folylpolyglutamate synthase/dihydrofolate synthase [Leucobacter soli]|uniref:bifunctional folylpolyglutamate synthase/dihydrofolate synthase n=1 Tax=Leucobacter soli TaxID=2812850 RepID=UPI00361F7159
MLAFALFADAPIDVAVVEVGMGGEWDATNIADAEVAVFAPIDLDHTSVLGADVATIARTKAGIVKPASTVVTAAQAPEALAELIEAAENADARLYVFGRDFALLDDRLAVGGRQIAVRGFHGHEYDPAFVPLFGHHQAENVALAIAAVEAFLGAERPIPEEVVEEALGGLTSPGRLQLIGSEPVVYVDAAHNPHGAEALARAVTESFNFSEVALVVGSLADKDTAGVFEELAPIADLVYAVPVDSPRSLPVDDVVDLAEGAFLDVPVEPAESLTEALEVAREWAVRDRRRAVLVVGSVLLAGEAIALSRSEGWGSHERGSCAAIGRRGAASLPPRRWLTTPRCESPARPGTAATRRRGRSARSPRSCSGSS